jgi:hypothetical protein
MAHPQSGKSMATTDFIAWVAGKNPELKTIFASYSDAHSQDNFDPRMQSTRQQRPD